MNDVKRIIFKFYRKGFYYYWVGYTDARLKGDWRWKIGDLEYKFSDNNLWKNKVEG